MEYDVKDLIIIALKKSDEALLAAEFNYKNMYYETCQNRLYYAVFYAASALAYKENFITSKHSQLLGWFNKKYIYDEKIFDKKMSAIYKEVFNSRQLSDYDFMYIPNSDEILIMFHKVKYFISEVKKFLISDGIFL